MPHTIASELSDLDALLAAAQPEGMPERSPRALAAHAVPHALTPHLVDIARLARNGLTLAQIAAWLGHSPMVLEEAARRFDDVRRALVGGRMLGIDKATAKLAELVDKGDIAAIKFYLERRGGWAKAPGPGVTVQVNTGGQSATIDASNVDSLASDHSDLLDRVSRGESFEIEKGTGGPALAPPVPSLADLEAFTFDRDRAPDERD